MDPIAYNLVDPNEAILGGLRLGVGLDQIAQQRQQQQQAQEAAQQQQRVLMSLATNPNAGHADYAAVMTAYPSLAENLGKAFKVKDEAEKQNWINFGSRVYSASLTGNNDLAIGLLRDRAKADPNNAQHWNTMADLFQQSPQYARTLAAVNMAGLMGPDKFKEGFTGLTTDQRAAEKQPAEVAQAQALAEKTAAEATKEQVAAANAPTKTDLENKTAASNLVTAEQKRILDWYDLQIKQADSETKRGELTLARDKFVAENNIKQQDRGQAAAQQFDTITDTINIVRSLQQDMQKNRGTLGTFLAAQIPGMDAGPGVGTTVSKVLAYVPGSDAKDFRAKLETLKSKQFLAQAQNLRGMGALSNAEGERIERAVASLDADQSPQAFNNALGVIQTTLEKGHQRLVASGQLPKDNTPFVMNHPRFGKVTEADVTRLMQQQPGTTREQVLQYLKETGGK